MIDETNGVGRVCVKYTDPQAVQGALKALAERSFSGRSIVVTSLTDDSQTLSLNLIYELHFYIRCTRW